jgi:recombination endonuclease VII
MGRTRAAINRERAKVWYANNKERAKKRIARWQKDNPEKVKASRLKRKESIRRGQRKCYKARRSYYIARSKAWSENNRNQRRKIARDWVRKRTLRQHGLTEETYGEMRINQKNKCAICRRKTNLVIDHCHRTSKVRGLLCFLCNLGLGSFRDSEKSLRKAVAYLRGSNV